MSDCARCELLEEELKLHEAEDARALARLAARVEALEKALRECEQTLGELGRAVPLKRWQTICQILERAKLAREAARKLLEGKL